jgi:hypothetical protein
VAPQAESEMELLLLHTTLRAQAFLFLFFSHFGALVDDRFLDVPEEG